MLTWKKAMILGMKHILDVPKKRLRKLGKLVPNEIERLITTIRSKYHGLLGFNYKGS